MSTTRLLVYTNESSRRPTRNQDDRRSPFSQFLPDHRPSTFDQHLHEVMTIDLFCLQPTRAMLARLHLPIWMVAGLPLRLVGSWNGLTPQLS